MLYDLILSNIKGKNLDIEKTLLKEVLGYKDNEIEEIIFYQNPDPQAMKQRTQDIHDSFDGKYVWVFNE